MSELFERCPACEGRRTTGRAASGAVALCDKCEGEGYVPAAVPGPVPDDAPVHPWTLFSNDVRRREAERDAANRRADGGKGGGA